MILLGTLKQTTKDTKMKTTQVQNKVKVHSGAVVVYNATRDFLIALKEQYTTTTLDWVIKNERAVLYGVNDKQKRGIARVFCHV